MDTSIVVRKLTDGSEVHEVIFVDGSAQVRVSAMDERAAMRISACLMRDAAYAEVHGAI